jgi:hypothetical protein
VFTANYLYESLTHWNRKHSITPDPG